MASQTCNFILIKPTCGEVMRMYSTSFFVKDINLLCLVETIKFLKFEFRKIFPFYEIPPFSWKWPFWSIRRYYYLIDSKTDKYYWKQRYLMIEIKQDKPRVCKDKTWKKQTWRKWFLSSFFKIKFGKMIYKFTFITSPFGLSIKQLIYISFKYITTFQVSWENQRSFLWVFRRLLRLCFVYYFVKYWARTHFVFLNI